MLGHLVSMILNMIVVPLCQDGTSTTRLADN